MLSPSTEAYDRGDKFTYYKSIPSFREYLLIAQHRPHITHYVKSDTGKWDYEETNDLSSSSYLPTIDCKLALKDLYAGVEFVKDENNGSEAVIELLRSSRQNATQTRTRRTTEE